MSKVPPPIPVAKRPRRDTVPMPIEQRIALRIACQAPHPRLVRRVSDDRSNRTGGRPVV